MTFDDIILRSIFDADYEYYYNLQLSLVGVVYEWKDANGVKHILNPLKVNIVKEPKCQTIKNG